MTIYMIAIREDDPEHIRDLIKQFNREIEEPEDLDICLQHINELRADYFRTRRAVIRIKEQQYV